MKERICLLRFSSSCGTIPDCVESKWAREKWAVGAGVEERCQESEENSKKGFTKKIVFMRTWHVRKISDEKLQQKRIAFKEGVKNILTTSGHLQRTQDSVPKSSVENRFFFGAGSGSPFALISLQRSVVCCVPSAEKIPFRPLRRIRDIFCVFVFNELYLCLSYPALFYKH